jgi:hypothetical protein
MKKIIAILTTLVLLQAATYAQKEKAQTVAEQDVPERYVKDFQRQAPEAKHAVWTKEKSDIYRVDFTSSDMTQSIRFTPRGLETRYAVDLKWTPQAIKDSVAHNYPKYKIREVNVLNVKNKSTYEAKISLSKKKDKSAKLLNFETDGKFIDAVEVE